MDAVRSCLVVAVGCSVDTVDEPSVVLCDVGQLKFACVVQSSCAQAIAVCEGSLPPETIVWWWPCPGLRLLCTRLQSKDLKRVGCDCPSSPGFHPNKCFRACQTQIDFSKVEVEHIIII